MESFMTATEARRRFYDVIDAAEHPGVAVTITHEGMPKVVVMSFEEYEGWQETLEIMADPALDRELEEAVRTRKAGKLHADTVSLAEVKKKLHLGTCTRSRSKRKC